jgi:hypothetical protein
MKRITTRSLIAIAVILSASLAGFGYLFVLDDPCEEEYKKQFKFAQLSDSAKATYWQAHLQNKLNELSSELDPTRYNLVAEGMEFVTAENYGANLSEDAVMDEGGELYEWRLAVEANFTAEEQMEIFYDLPEFTPGEWTPVDEELFPARCTCSRWGNRCIFIEGPVYCRYETTGGCTPSRYCGFYFLFTCYGRCSDL